jgi:hypothetical protein
MQSRLAQYPRDSLRYGCRIVLDYQSSNVCEQWRDSALIRNDHRRTSGHCFARGVPKIFILRR